MPRPIPVAWYRLNNYRVQGLLRNAGVSLWRSVKMSSTSLYGRYVLFAILVSLCSNSMSTGLIHRSTIHPIHHFIHHIHLTVWGIFLAI